MTKQAERRKLAKLRAEMNGSPWAIDVRALGSLSAAIELGDLEAVRASLSLGSTEDSITKIVNGIAVIPITGTLQDECNYMVRWGNASSYQLIERDFNQALDNTQVKGVLFYVNSPGGSAIGCKRIADLVFESRGIKPIRAFVQGICCSAAYYIASATDRVECTADSLVGSIGTIMPHMEYAGALKEMGIGAQVFTNSDSPKKGHGNVYEPLTPEAKKTLQQFVDSYGGPFISDVARYRGVDAEQITKDFGQGDAMRADIAITRRMVDAIVGNFEESLESMSSGDASSTPVEEPQEPAAEAVNSKRSSTMNERIKAQLFALGLIDSLTASEDVCKATLSAWCGGRGESLPSDEAQILASLQKPAAPKVSAEAAAPAAKPADNVQQAHIAEQAEARSEQLTAAADLFNSAIGREAVTAKMVLDSVNAKQDVPTATKKWAEIFASEETPVDASRVKHKGEGADRYAADVVDALVYRAGNNIQLSADAQALANRPLWAVAIESLKNSGHQVDAYGPRELIAEEAMSMGFTGARHTFYSPKENRKYLQASASPAARPGDFPNILSAFANKYLDTIELDEDYSYPDISALLPGGLNDFKPGLMVNKGVVEEMDEVQDAEAFKELGLQEEVLSYIFMRRFGNKFGWTPVMIANDDLNAFAEGMIGLSEAWEVTQNRLCVDLIASNPTLLDGSALFANRTDVNGAANDNDIDSGGGVPSDTEWADCEVHYSDIGGIGTGRRVRGSLNTWFGPTGTPHIEARRTFLPLSTGGLEPKSADTTANVGIYRGLIKLVPESELRGSSTLKWYAMRSPTRLNTATIVRAYFNGFGEQGRRERWYDPTNKTTWVSLEGRIATAVKNWRYAVRNKGEA